MRKHRIIAALIASTVLLGAVACDDKSPQNQEKVDEDDSNLGPGDGGDETGPGR